MYSVNPFGDSTLSCNVGSIALSPECLWIVRRYRNWLEEFGFTQYWFFPQLLLLLPRLTSNLQVTIAKHRRTSSSCTRRWCHCSGSLRRFLEGLIDHLVAIGWWLLTLHNTYDPCDRCVSISIHSRTGKETDVNVTVGFNGVVLKQRWYLNFDTVSITMIANFYVQDWADHRVLENPSPYTSLLLIARHRIFSA